MIVNYFLNIFAFVAIFVYIKYDRWNYLHFTWYTKLNIHYTVHTYTFIFYLFRIYNIISCKLSVSQLNYWLNILFLKAVHTQHQNKNKKKNLLKSLHWENIFKMWPFCTAANNQLANYRFTYIKIKKKRRLEHGSNFKRKQTNPIFLCIISSLLLIFRISVVTFHSSHIYDLTLFVILLSFSQLYCVFPLRFWFSYVIFLVNVNAEHYNQTKWNNSLRNAQKIKIKIKYILANTNIVYVSIIM